MTKKQMDTLSEKEANKLLEGLKASPSFRALSDTMLDCVKLALQRAWLAGGHAASEERIRELEKK